MATPSAPPHPSRGSEGAKVSAPGGPSITGQWIRPCATCPPSTRHTVSSSCAANGELLPVPPPGHVLDSTLGARQHLRGAVVELPDDDGAVEAASGDKLASRRDGEGQHRARRGARAVGSIPGAPGS